MINSICKKTCLVCLSIVLLFILPLDKGVYASSYNGLEYYYSEENQGIIISGYDNENHELIIPEKIDGKLVVGIGLRAFYNCDNLYKVRIPDTVTFIEGAAFDKCYNLTEIKIPNSVTTIEGSAFYDCINLKSVYLPNSITSIGKSTFAYCYKLSEITIPDSVKTIGREAFYSCSSLSEINIPNSVTYIGSDAFGFSGLKTVTIPDSVTNINHVFNYCHSLVEVNISDSVTNMYQSFCDCENLSVVKLPNSAVNMSGAFKGCSKLEKIDIPDSVTSIGEWTFFGCTNLTDIKIPCSVNSIGDFAFYNCSSLSTVLIPQSVVNIGVSSFFTGEDITIIGAEDSYVENYAKENGIMFEKHNHKFTENIDKEASCLVDGFRCGCYCEICGFVKDAEEVIPALGHNMVIVEGTARDATCYGSGHEADKICTRCNYMQSGASISPKGHKEEDIPEVAASCITDGSSGGKKCSVCGFILEEPTIIPALGHEPKNTVKENEKNPTCTEKGSYDSVIYCNRCNDVISKETIETYEALGHDWDKGKVTKNASCSEEGEMTFKCSRCDGTYTDTIERKAHTPEPILSVEASCTVDGLSEGSKCSECGAILTPQTVTTKALGHNWEETIVMPATCQKTGKKVIKCTRCGEEKEETISKNAHSIVVDPAVEATATSTGLTLGTHCSVCGEIIVPQTVIPVQTNGDSSVDKPKENNNPSDSNVNPGNEGNANTIPKNITDQDSQNSSGSSEAASNTTPEPAAQPQPQVPAYSSEWVDGKWYDAQGNQTYSGTLEWKANSSGWWIEDTDGWYPVSCWQKIDGFWYYFDSSGYMVTSAWQDGCWLGSNGAWTYEPTGLWKGDSSGWWFEDTSGWYPNSQWLKINGSWYYFDGSGYMVTSKYIDGYWIGADGVCQ